MLSSPGRPQKFFQGGGQRQHFAYHFQVADVAMKMDVHKTLSSFYTTKKIPHESTRSIRIYFEIFFKWSCRLYEFATKVYFRSSVTTFAELAHKCRYHCEVHTNESEMDLNYQQLRLRLSHLSVLIEQNWLEKSFVRFLHFGNAFDFPKLPNIHFCEHFLQTSRTLKEQSTLRPTLALKNQEVRCSQNCFTVS